MPPSRDAVTGRFVSSGSGAELERLLVRILGDNTHLVKTLMNSQKAVSSLSTNLVKVGKMATTAISIPLAGAATLGVKAFADFDDAMVKSTAIMTDLDDQIEQTMRTQALHMAQNGVQSATELAQSYFFLASAGLSAEQSIAALPIVQSFATAGAFDMARATDLVTDAQSALGLSSKDTAEAMKNMTRVSDVLVKANTLANATVEQFSIALTSKAGASLKAFNKDIEEGVAVLAAFADQGVKAELAGNQLDRIIRLLSKTSMDNAEAHKELGFSVFDSTGKMRNLGDVVANLENILRGMSDETKVATLDILGFEARVQQAILPLLGTSDAIKRYEKELRDAGGTTSTVADKQLKSLTSQMKMLWNTIKVAAIGIGEVLSPAVEWVTEKVKLATEWFNNLTKGQKQLIVTVGAIAAAIGPLMITLGIMGNSIIGLVGAIGAIGTVVSTVGAPVLAVVAAVAALSTAVAGLVAYLVGTDGLKQAWDTVLEASKNMLNKTIGFFQNWSANVQIITEWVKDNWLNLIRDMGSSWLGTFKSMVNNAKVSVDILYRLWTTFNGWFVVQIQRVMTVEFLMWVSSGLKEAAKMVWSFGKEVAKSIVAALSGQTYDMSGFIEQMSRDFKNGMENENLGDAFNRIIQEEAKNFKSPFDFFERSTTPLNLMLDGAKEESEKLTATLIDQSTALKGLANEQDNVFKKALPDIDAKKKVKKATEETNKVLKENEERLRAIQAVESGSAEALFRISQFRANSPQNVSPARVPQVNHLDAAHRDVLENLLERVAEAVEKDDNKIPIVIEAANLTEG